MDVMLTMSLCHPNPLSNEDLVELDQFLSEKEKMDKDNK